MQEAYDSRCRSVRKFPTAITLAVVFPIVQALRVDVVGDSVRPMEAARFEIARQPHTCIMCPWCSSAEACIT